MPTRPLTAEEYIILASDRRLSPLAVGVVAETDGRLDLDALRAAVAGVLGRHPMARATLRESGSALVWRFPWTPDTDPVEELVDGEGDRLWAAMELLSSRPFDLRRFPPVRLVLARRQSGDALGLVAHHAALDGVSAVTLMTEILDGYRTPPGTPPSAPSAEPSAEPPAESLAGSPKPAGPAEPARAAGAAGAAAPSGAPSRNSQSSRTNRTSRSARGVRRGPRTRLASGRAALLRRIGSGPHHMVPVGPADATGYRIHPLSLPVPQPLQLPDGRRMTVNDLLLAAAHLAVARWNEQQAAATDTVRVRMPITANHGAGQPDAARELGNHAGQSMVTTTRQDRADPLTLALRVVEQTRAAKDAEVSWAGPAVQTVLEVAITAMPGRVRSALLRAAVSTARRWMTPSLVVSNVGRFAPLPRFGPDGPRVTDVYFHATAGMPQGMMIGAVGLDGRLYLTFCHHRALLDRPGIARFAQIYQDALAELTALGSAGRDPRPPAGPAAAAGGQPAARDALAQDAGVAP